MIACKLYLVILPVLKLGDRATSPQFSVRDFLKHMTSLESSTFLFFIYYMWIGSYCSVNKLFIQQVKFVTPFDKSSWKGCKNTMIAIYFNLNPTNVHGHHGIRGEGRKNAWFQKISIPPTEGLFQFDPHPPQFSVPGDSMVLPPPAGISKIFQLGSAKVFPFFKKRHLLICLSLTIQALYHPAGKPQNT